MSNAASVTLGYANESTYGTTPGGAFNEFKFASESLKARLATVRSSHILGNRMTENIFRTDLQPMGTVPCELQYLSHDDIIKGALFSSGFGTPGVTVSGVNLSASNASTPHFVRASGDFENDLYVAGQWMYLAGFSNAANNGWWKVVSTADTVIVVPSAVTAEGAAAGKTIKCATHTIGGTTQNSFSLEKQFTDNTTDFEIIKGALVDKWSLVLPDRGLITQSFDFVGKTIASATATAGSGTLTSVSTAPSIPTPTGVTVIAENGVALTAMGLTINVANNLRAHGALGTLGPTDYGKGDQDIEGTLDVYYSNSTLIDKAINSTSLTASSLFVGMVDSTGNRLFIEMPAIKYVDAERLAVGRDGDVVARMKWQAYRSTNAYDLCQIKYGRLSASA